MPHEHTAVLALPPRSPLERGGTLGFLMGQTGYIHRGSRPAVWVFRKQRGWVRRTWSGEYRPSLKAFKPNLKTKSLCRPTVIHLLVNSVLWP